MTKKSLIRAGVYKHYKGGIYKVISIAKHSETKEDMVVYKSLDKEHQLWVRSLKMFTEMVEVEGGKVPRFQKIDN
ncbi:DUF1653 domain-containing protein [Patescibacteria group bacterium]|nr:DUF1653 domain-containing protein [Patescibacteria group bacterium]